jgi:hypothetical protein
VPRGIVTARHPARRPWRTSGRLAAATLALAVFFLWAATAHAEITVSYNGWVLSITGPVVGPAAVDGVVTGPAVQHVRRPVPEQRVVTRAAGHVLHRGDVRGVRAARHRVVGQVDTQCGGRR